MLIKAVLNVQKECVKICYEGNRTLDDIHRDSVDLLTRELRSINLNLESRVLPLFQKEVEYRIWKRHYIRIMFRIMLAWKFMIARH